MGKHKRTHGKLKGKEVAYPSDIHPVDMSRVTAVCDSCKADNEAPSIDDLMKDNSRLAIVFKYWLPTDTTCDVCHKKEPYQVYDFEASGVATHKMFEIVAACELKSGNKILDFGHQLDDASREVLKVINTQIRKTYKDVKVAKRPVTTIRQVDDIFFQLDHDGRLRARDKITFKCKNGSVSFSLVTAMLGFRV